MSTLIVQVPRVTHSPARFRLESDAEWWRVSRPLFRDPDAGLLRAFVVDLEGYRLGNRLLFRGEVTGAVELPCGRCVEPYAHEFREALELLLEPIRVPEGQLQVIPEGGIELDPEDLELGRYAGDELDFGGILREILLFAWPMQPRCAESCLGLCPRCGANRNRESCECDARAGSRPFEALGKLLEPSRDESN